MDADSYICYSYLTVNDKQISHKEKGNLNMKKTFITAAVTAAIIAAIIAVRMILSVILSEHAAEVFCRVSISALFFYSICRLSKNRLKKAN